MEFYGTTWQCLFESKIENEVVVTVDSQALLKSLPADSLYIVISDQLEGTIVLINFDRVIRW